MAEEGFCQVLVFFENPTRERYNAGRTGENGEENI
jgi:hypothetical protein